MNIFLLKEFFLPDCPFAVEAMSRNFLREVDVHVGDRDVMKFTLDGSWTVARLRKELFQLVFGTPPVKNQHKENAIFYTYVADMDDNCRGEQELTREECLRSEDDRKHCKTVVFPRYMLRFKHITYCLNTSASSDESSSDDEVEQEPPSSGYSPMIEHAKTAGVDLFGDMADFWQKYNDFDIVWGDGNYKSGLPIVFSLYKHGCLWHRLNRNQLEMVKAYAEAQIPDGCDETTWDEKFVATGDPWLVYVKSSINRYALGKDYRRIFESIELILNSKGASSEASDEEEFALNITDYINIPDEPWECRLLSKDYLEDETDFITPLHIVLNKHTCEHLLDLNLYDSVFDLKDWMVQKFATMTEDGQEPFPPSAFRLGCGSRLLRDDETVADVAQGESKITLKILLVLRGGGIPVQRLEKTKAKVEHSKKSLSACASKVSNDVKLVPVVKKIEDVVQGFMASLDTVGVQQTLLKYMTDLVKTSPQKASEIVKYLEQSTAGSPEVKMRHIAGKFFCCEGISEKIEELKMADESLKFALLIGFQRMICENKSKKEYTISSFGEALDTVLKMIELFCFRPSGG